MKKLLAILTIFLIPITTSINFEVELKDAKEDVTDKNIDIIRIWTEEKHNEIAFSMEIAGRIESENVYTFTASSNSEQIGITYVNQNAYYLSSTASYGELEYSIDENIITIYVPFSIFSGWQEFHLAATTGNGKEVDYVYESWEGGNESKVKDPSMENATDDSIKVSIKKVEYEIKKMDNMWDIYFKIEGITNGVDHVSLNFIIYYKNGSHEYGEWLRGPFEIKPTAFSGNEIQEFRFNATEENWKKWEYVVKMKTQALEEYEWAGKKDVEKIRIYARAFKDADEEKWNQAYYDTKPEFSGNEVKYMEEKKENEKKKGIAGFEFVLFIVAIIIMARRK